MSKYTPQQLDLLFDVEPIGLVATRLTHDVFAAEASGDPKRLRIAQRAWNRLITHHAAGGDVIDARVNLLIEITKWVRQREGDKVRFV